MLVSPFSHAFLIVPILTPTPLGIVLVAGTWIIEHTEKVYYIEVEGSGATAEESRLNGFRLAVEQAVGSLVASETEVQDEKLIRDEIISYASGYVNEFNIEKVYSDNELVKTKMKVWVKKTTLSDRLLHQSKEDGVIDGQRASVAIETSLHERNEGDRLLRTVLNDFPKNSFNIGVGKPQIGFDFNRRAMLTVPFSIAWSPEYLRSVENAVKATAQSDSVDLCKDWQVKFTSRQCEPSTYIQVISEKWMGGVTTAGFSDIMKTNAAVQSFIGKSPSILITLHGTTNNVIYRQCHFLPELDHNMNSRIAPVSFVDVKNNTLEINGKFVANTSALVDVTNLPVDAMTQVSIEIVPRTKCPI
jgi:hypothetical protein